MSAADLDVEGFARLVAAVPTGSWQAWIVRLAPGDCSRFATCCREGHIARIDTIERQLADLAHVRRPAAGAAERDRFVAEALVAAGDPAAVGTWAYLPWQSTVVHTLDRDEYFEVITNRNRDKITRAEQQRLRTKRIGVLGLSVGGEAAVTVAQEHLCGEIVLADFDRLDLSNLNRLQAGVDDLGLAKTTIVARRIARIDPYLTVRVFEDGVTPTNLAAFLDGLDLLIEECDSLPIKLQVREHAKAREINVVFAADERGFLSVEPYAQWSTLRPFHGLVAAPPLPREGYPSPRAFLKALTQWLGGWRNISDRSRRSLERVGEALCGYPQLASEARYAAGQIGHVARRLLLGERLQPFVGNLDLAEYLPAHRMDAPVKDADGA
ncbi:MAG TPA: ThiF family adenylyltransferase [Gemmatimonadales bacterium]|nr:ThiF family adenylyltransferase [Gemmatimonadales bacterium]